NNLFVNMVRAGEVGGVLETVLNRLSEFQEKAARIKNKVVAAMVYPIIVMTMAVGIMAFLLVFIVPKFEAIFHDMLGDKPLPAVTQFVIGASSLVKDHGLVLLGAVIVAVTAYKFIGRTRGGRFVIDSFKLRMPLVGDLNDDAVDNSVAAFTSLLGPFIIVFLALMVGTIVLALFTPLISIIDGLQQQT